MKKKILSVVLAVSVMASAFVSLNLGSVLANTDDSGKYAWENFENMTDSQASNFFSGSKDGTVTVSQKITQNGEDGSKGLEVNMNIPYSWAWVNFASSTLAIPENAIGMYMYYTLSQDTNMRLQLKDQSAGSWTDMAFEGTAASKGLAKAGTYNKTITFDETFDSTHMYALGLEAAATADGNPASVLTIDNITFITLENYEDFASTTEAQAKTYFTGSKDGTVTETQKIVTNPEDSSSKGLEVKMDIPYSWAWVNYASSTLKIPENAIGISMYYTLSQDTNMRLQLKDQTQGSWTDMAFEGTAASKGLAKAGTYVKTVPFDETFDSTHMYALGLEAAATADGNPATVLTIYDIMFVCLGTSASGDNTQLSAKIAEVKATADTDESLYTADSWAVFDKAYKAAVALVADSSATQRQLDQAKDTLTSAFESLEPLFVIKTALKTQLDSAKAILDDSSVLTKYTEKSVKALQTAYDNAKTVYDDADALQSNVNKEVEKVKSAISALKKIPSADELVYPVKDEKLIMDFEHFEDSADMGTLDYTINHPFQTDSGLKETLDKKTAISGEKSMKISWETLGDDFWGAERMYLMNGILQNQALYFDIVIPVDFNATFQLYDESNTSAIYEYTIKINGSNNVQHIILPFNEFKCDGVPMTADAWTEFCSGKCILKMNINKALGGLKDNSFMIIDNMTLITLDGLKAEYTYNYTTLPGTTEPVAPNPGDDGDKDDEGNKGDVSIDGDLGDSYTEIKKFETPVNSINLKAEELKDLVGSGMYFYVKSDKDNTMLIKITDGNVTLNYEVAVKASSSPYLLNVDYTSFKTAVRTFGELDRAKMTLDVSFADDAEISSFGSYDYTKLYAAINGINPGDGNNGNNGNNGSNGGNGNNGSNGSGNDSPKTGDATRVTLYSMLAVLALGAIVTVRKVIVSNK